MGFDIPAGRELRDCDVGERFAALSLVEQSIDEPFPEDLVDSLATFDDLVHYANVRRAQERRDSCWVE